MNSTPAAAAVQLLAFALVCGLSAFATIEALKRIAPVRGYYQRRQAHRWFQVRAQAALFPRQHNELPDPQFVERVIEQAWVALLKAMGTTENTGETLQVFNVPSEQLAALVSSAVDLLLGQLQIVIDFGAWGIDSPSQSDYGLDPTVFVFSLMSLYEFRPPAADPSQSQQVLEDFARRARAGVDQFQISVGQGWQRYVQGAAVWMAGWYGIALSRGLAVQGANVGALVVVALVVGGAFAWTLRDISAGIERFRR